MLKRKTLFLAAAVIATIAMFAASEVMAFNDDACYGWNYDDNAAGCSEEPLRNFTDPISGFSMTLVEGYPTLLQGTCPFGDQCYEWKYSVTTPGLSFAAWFIPDCCTTPLISLGNFSPENLTLFPVGQGEPEVKFGKYNNLGQVLKGTPDSTNHYSFVANTNVLTSSAAIAKVKKFGVLAFEIAVPGCFPAPEPPCVPQLAAGQAGVRIIGSTLINRLDPEDNKDICVVISDAATCEGEVYDVPCDQINNNDPVGSTANPITVPIANGIVGFTGQLTGSPLCPAGTIEINQGGCWAVYVGGRPIAYIPSGCGN